MTPTNSKKEELRDRIAIALGLEKGGITEHPSPANEHYYFVNEVEDYDTEEIVITQRINFESRISNVADLIASELTQALKELKEEAVEQNHLINTNPHPKRPPRFVNERKAFIPIEAIDNKIKELASPNSKP